MIKSGICRKICLSRSEQDGLKGEWVVLGRLGRRTLQDSRVDQGPHAVACHLLLYSREHFLNSWKKINVRMSVMM